MKFDLPAGRGKQAPALLSNAGTAVYESFAGNVAERASHAHIDLIERVVCAALAEAARLRDQRRRLDLKDNRSATDDNAKREVQR